MKQRRTGMIILSALLTLVIFLYFLFNQDEKRYKWFENYRVSSDQPYGTMFIKKLLESYHPDGDFMMNDKRPLRHLLQNAGQHDGMDYIFIGQNILLDQESKAALIRFMEAGGNAFIASLTPPEEILNSVYFKECGHPITLNPNRVSSVNLNFFHDSLRMASDVAYAFRFMAEDYSYSWNYFHGNVFCDSTKSIVPLGYQADGYVNFIKIPAGRGNLYLHSNPLVFTNYFLTQPQKLRYAEGVFSHLDGKDIIWDEYSKISFLGNNNVYDSPLYYIMQQASLKYAWWLLLVTVILYVIFGGKRKQRIIPVREAKTNTSLEFVNLISRLHYKNGNHLDMAHKKMKYFLYFVRSRYGIHAEKFREEHIMRLSEKSSVQREAVEVIFMQYDLIEQKFRNNIEANRLVDLYDSIDNFYKQCK